MSVQSNEGPGCPGSRMARSHTVTTRQCCAEDFSPHEYCNDLIWVNRNIQGGRIVVWGWLVCAGTMLAVVMCFATFCCTCLCPHTGCCATNFGRRTRARWERLCVRAGASWCATRTSLWQWLLHLAADMLFVGALPDSYCRGRATVRMVATVCRMLQDAKLHVTPNGVSRSLLMTSLCIPAFVMYQQLHVPYFTRDDIIDPEWSTSIKTWCAPTQLQRCCARRVLNRAINGRTSSGRVTRAHCSPCEGQPRLLARGLSWRQTCTSRRAPECMTAT